MMRLAASDQPGEILRDGAGLPVWPAANPADRAALEGVARLFGTNLDFVTAEPGLAATRGGLVIGIGEDVEDLARLYAHLTRRGFAMAEDGSALRDLSPSVVVTTLGLVSVELLDSLYSPDCGNVSPGMILADTVEALRSQVLIRSAAAALTSALPPLRIDLFPAQAFSATASETGMLLGGSASKPEYVRALSLGASVVSLLTHSDGIDAKLGPLVLCPMQRVPLVFDEARLPTCQITRMCHRLSMPLEQALESGALLSPEAISTRVLVFAVCWGLLLKSSVDDYAWSLLARLLASSTIGAVLTSWEVILVTSDDLAILCKALIAGRTAGEALSEFLRDTGVRQKGIRMCLLGDPELRAYAPE
jgi:hypothetical protein